MIDVHCHLEQRDYDEDRDEVIKRALESGLKGVITSCVHPDDFEKCLELKEKYKGFVFLTMAVHPEYIEEFSDDDVKKNLEWISDNVSNLVGIGETGLDFYWVKDETQRKRQKEMFVAHINLAKEFDKPVVIHSRDAFDETFRTLVENGAEKVHWHMFGAHHLWKEVVDRDWMISVNAILFRSKKHKKIVRDVPLENIMLETDAPWLALEKGKRNEPTTIIKVAEKIAEIKGLSFEEVWKTCGKNAKRFYKLSVDLD